MAYNLNRNNGTQTNLYTNGNEYRCQNNNYAGCGQGPNGTYVGYYHIHPEKGAMAGATHSNQSHPILISVNGSNQYNPGGMLHGPTHQQGGIPARVGGSEMVELEGGEYIINAQTVNAVGEGFLNKLNSTATTYHTGGFNQGQLPSPSTYANGGKVPNRRNKMRRGYTGQRGQIGRRGTSTTRRRRTGKPMRNVSSPLRNRSRNKSHGRIMRTGGRPNQNLKLGRGIRNIGSRRSTTYRHGGAMSMHNSRGGITDYNSMCPPTNRPDYVHMIKTPAGSGASTKPDFICCKYNWRSPECTRVEDKTFLDQSIARLPGNRR